MASAFMRWDEALDHIRKIHQNPLPQLKAVLRRKEIELWAEEVLILRNNDAGELVIQGSEKMQRLDLSINYKFNEEHEDALYLNRNEGVGLHGKELLLLRDEIVGKFPLPPTEDERRQSASIASGLVPVQKRGGGAPVRYDWEGAAVEMARILILEGFAGSPSELEGRVKDWFSAKSVHGDHPAESLIRTHVKVFLQAVRPEANN